MARGRKFEEKQLRYAMYSQIVREGGLKVPIIMRFSLIPGHCASCSAVGCLLGCSHACGGRFTVTTAVFATCGMSSWRFLISATVGLPKQLAAVYIGDGESADGCKFFPTLSAQVLCLYLLRRSDDGGGNRCQSGRDLYHWSGHGHCYALPQPSDGRGQASRYLRPSQSPVRSSSSSLSPFSSHAHSITSHLFPPPVRPSRHPRINTDSHVRVCAGKRRCWLREAKRRSSSPASLQHSAPLA